MALVVELSFPLAAPGGPPTGTVRTLATRVWRRRGLGERLWVEAQLAPGGFDSGRAGSPADLVAAARAQGRAVVLRLGHTDAASTLEEVLDLALPLTPIPLGGEEPIVVELDGHGRLLAVVTAWRRDWLVPHPMIYSATRLRGMLAHFAGAVHVHPGFEAALDTVLSKGPEDEERPVAVAQSESRAELLRRLLAAAGRDLGLGPLHLGGGAAVGRDWWLVPGDFGLVAAGAGPVPPHPGGAAAWRRPRLRGAPGRPEPLVAEVVERCTGPWDASAWRGAMQDDPPWSAADGAWVHAVEDELVPSGGDLGWSRYLHLLPRGARLSLSAPGPALGPATVLARVAGRDPAEARASHRVELDPLPLPEAVADELRDESYELEDVGTERRGAPPEGEPWEGLLSTPSSGADGTTGLHLVPCPGSLVVVQLSGRLTEPAAVLGNLREEAPEEVAPSCHLEDELLLHLAPVRVLATGPVRLEPSVQVDADQDLELSVAGDLRVGVEGRYDFDGAVAAVKIEDYRLESSGGVALLATGDTSLGGRGATHLAGDGELHLSGGQTAVALRGGNIHMG